MSNSTDPLVRATQAIKAAERERDNLSNASEQARIQNHQLRRRLSVAEEQNQALQDRVAALMAQVDAANDRADAHKRAMLEHAGRSR